MALTLFEAAKAHRNPLARGLMMEIATSDQFIAKLRMSPKVGSAFSYNRENALPTAEFVSPSHTSLTESSATFDNVTVPIRMLVSDVDVYQFPAGAQSSENDQTALQLQQKAKSAGRTIADKAINGAYATSVTYTPTVLAIDASSVSAFGDSNYFGKGTLKYVHSTTTWSWRAPGDRDFGAGVVAATDGTYTLSSDNPNKKLTLTLDVSDATADFVADVQINSTNNEPDGLKKMITTAQTVSSSGANGDALSFDAFDKLIDLVKHQDDPAFVCNSAILRKYFGLVRALGGTTPEHVAIPGISAPVPTYRGIPILKCDNVASNESKGSGTTLSSLYLVDFAPEHGFWAGVASDGSMNFDASPASVPVMGLKYEDVGILEDKDARRSRIKWYGAYALGSTLSAARASELVTA